MILYQYRCLACNELTDAFREIDDRNRAPDCQHCGGTTIKIISRYSAHSDLTPYYDENLESHITSRQHRQKVMRERGVSEKFGKGWT